MKRKMLQFAPELAEKLDHIIAACGYPTEKKKMFGHEVHFLNTYMFSGANEEGIFVHIGSEAKETALKTETGVAPFKPIEGMVMKDYLLLHEPVYSNPDTLKKWLDQSSRYLLSLPPKKKKPKRKKS
jgi:TfoX/Sxy family transcriptional regulator of competence genes